MVFVAIAFLSQIAQTLTWRETAKDLHRNLKFSPATTVKKGENITEAKSQFR